MDFGSTFEVFSFSGDSVNCYGLEIVKRVLSSRGMTVTDLDYRTKDPVLVSLYWPEQLFDFIRWRYDGKMKDKKVIVGGNFPTTSPQAVAPFCDGIFMGDGELWDGRSMDYMAEKGRPKKRAIAENISPYPYEDIQQSRRTFVEISRGCTNRCLFCQYGWLKPYRECDYADIEQNINLAKTKSIRVFAADRFQHKAYQKIRELLKRRGKTDTGSDVSIKFLLKHPEYLQYTNKIRVGIEGLSHRLRKMVKKDYSNDDLVRFSKLISDANIKCLDFYMIYGLPTETDDDVPEFAELLAKLNEALPLGYTIAIHWNAFTPSAQTPLQWAAPALGEFKALRNLFEGFRFNDRIKIYHKPKFTSLNTLIRRMLAIRATEETAKLVFNFAKKQTQLLGQPDLIMDEYKKGANQDLMAPWPTDIPMPWDDYCLYNKELMLKLYQKAVGA